VLESSPIRALEVPDNATWPRLVTGKHPRAVGTYGPAIAEWALERPGLHTRRIADLRWWQYYALDRIFEHDDDGALVWETVLLSGSRQIGKSVLERCAVSWRQHAAEHFGGPQDILHVAHKLIAAQEVWRPAARWALECYGKSAVRWANGEQQIELPDGSRWMIQAATDGAGVSFTLSMALVDEAWRISRAVVDGAITPTMAEAEQPQTWLVSTAGTSQSDLMIANRQLALGLDDAEADSSILLVEWSAPPDPDLDIDDPAVWRMASPHWDARRERRVRQARAKVTDAASELQFRQQWLNQWVPTTSDPLFDEARWRQAEWGGVLPAGPVSFGADIAADRSHAVIVTMAGGVAEVVDSRPGAAWVPGRLLELVERWTPAAIGIDGTGPAATVADQLAGTEAAPLLVVLTGRQLAAACQETYDDIVDGRLAARAHEDLDASVINARRRVFGQSWTFARASGGASGVALLAVAVAGWAAEHAPEAIERSRIW
jgi:Phage Terminase